MKHPIGRFFICKIKKRYDLVMVVDVNEHREPPLYDVLHFKKFKRLSVQGNCLSREIPIEDILRYSKTYEIDPENLELFKRLHANTLEKYREKNKS